MKGKELRERNGKAICLWALMCVALLALLYTPARAAGSDFQYLLTMKDGNGRAVTELSGLKAGQRITLSLDLIRRDQEGPYGVYGLEFQVLSTGLQYNQDGTGFGAGTVRADRFQSGLLVGMAYYDLNRVGITIDNPLRVCSWSYTVEDPASASLRLSSALVYAAGSDEAIHPDSGMLHLALDPEGGILQGINPSGEYVKGAQVTLPEPGREGYFFAGWSDGTAVYPAGAAYTLRESAALTAQWQPAVNLTLDPAGGRITGKDPGGIYPQGSEVTLPEAAQAGYDFTGWSDGVRVYPAGTAFPVSGDVTLTAQWVPGKPADFGDTHIAYVQGYEDGTVRPENPVTRAETVTMLYRLLSEQRRAKIFSTSNRFTDVSAGAWYNKAVASMARGGYVDGYPDGSFAPDRKITRAEFVTMVVRFVDPELGNQGFTDVRGHWAQDYISTAVGRGWVDGYADGTFRPDQPITRAEAVTIINRMLRRGVNSGSRLGDYKNFPDNLPGAWYYYEILEAANSHTYTGTRPGETWTGNRVENGYDAEKYE